MAGIVEEGRLLVRIFKKGDLRDCNNWRGVTFLPVISNKAALRRIRPYRPYAPSGAHRLDDLFLWQCSLFEKLNSRGK